MMSCPVPALCHRMPVCGPQGKFVHCGCWTVRPIGRHAPEHPEAASHTVERVPGVVTFSFRSKTQFERNPSCASNQRMVSPSPVSIGAQVVEHPLDVPHCNDKDELVVTLLPAKNQDTICPVLAFCQRSS